MVFKNRIDAGKQLAHALSRYRGQEVIVYALPRGGVVLGAEAAKCLDVPLDIIIPRKIGHPMAPEYAIGAVTETGQPVWSQSELESMGIEWRDRAVRLARQEAKRRRTRYQGDQRAPNPSGKTAIIVDDGIATGLTMIAAIRDLLEHTPRSIVVAVPVAPENLPSEILDHIDEMIVLHIPSGDFGAVGTYYEEFPQVEDEEVRGLLNAYRNLPVAEPLDLAAFNAVLATVKHFPVTSSEMAAQAKRLHAPNTVVSFFESIPKDVEFKDKTDMVRRSEEVELLMKEKSQQPNEYLTSYDS